ncbi:MAG: GNAT family N-acetyltransferase [Nitriliruptorales bacterium]|nr:GNAT family N-acetyltransferase [Nitriliruptorales bacterium]
MRLACFACGAPVEGDDVDDLGDQLLAHVRGSHDVPDGDQEIRNYAEATQRLTGPSERLAELGELTIHPVTDDRLDDWAAFFDHDAHVGNPEWAGCYCLEPHVAVRGAPEDDVPPSQKNRNAMRRRLGSGSSFGYLAYVDGRPAGWVNASMRAEYTLHTGEEEDPPGEQVVGVSCFIIAPPYRRHGIAAALLDRVLADAASRGAGWAEGYPFTEDREGDAGGFRGPRSLYDERGFEPVRQRARDTVVRRPV